MMKAVLATAAALLLQSAATATSVGDRVTANFIAQQGMPLTQADAETAGWNVAGTSSECNELYGVRYRRSPRVSPTVLYDSRGQIAGIQWGFNTTNGFPLHPQSSVISPPYFPPSSANSQEEGIWTLTAYVHLCHTVRD